MAAVVQTGAALAVAEQEGTLEGTFNWLGVLPEHGVHRRVPGNVGAERLECVEISLAVTWGRNNLIRNIANFPPRTSSDSLSL